MLISRVQVWLLLSPGLYLNDASNVPRFQTNAGKSSSLWMLWIHILKMRRLFSRKYCNARSLAEEGRGGKADPSRRANRCHHLHIVEF